MIKKEQKIKCNVENENLAIPEISTGEVPENDDKEPNVDEPISFDDLAIPEIHIKHTTKNNEENQK